MIPFFRPRGYAQFGEDSLLVKIFGEGFTGFFVDVGANDGVYGSNTMLLEERGWRGVLVEPNPALAEQCRQRRPKSITIERAVGGPDGPAEVELFEYSGEAKPGWPLHGVSKVGAPSHVDAYVRKLGATMQTRRVPSSTLDRILHDAGVEQAFDLLSLDVEGFELEALKGFSIDRFRPRIVITEDNSEGEELAVPNFLLERGYRYVYRTGVNDWFAREDDVARFDSLQTRFAMKKKLSAWKRAASRMFGKKR